MISCQKSIYCRTFITHREDQLDLWKDDAFLIITLKQTYKQIEIDAIFIR